MRNRHCSAAAFQQTKTGSPPRLLDRSASRTRKISRVTRKIRLRTKRVTQGRRTPDCPAMDCFLLSATSKLGQAANGISRSRLMPKAHIRRAVLLIDDEPLIRWAVSEALSQAGHEVVTASDGKQGLRAVASAPLPFDVIFLDLRLPDSDDLRTLIAIRARTPRSAVVLVTASHPPEVVSEAYRLGVSRVLDKPFDIVDVLKIVGASPAVSNTKGDFHGSTCRRRVPVSVSLDPSRDANATRAVGIRDLSAV